MIFSQRVMSSKDVVSPIENKLKELESKQKELKDAKYKLRDINTRHDELSSLITDEQIANQDPDRDPEFMVSRSELKKCQSEFTHVIEKQKTETNNTKKLENEIRKLRREVEELEHLNIRMEHMKKGAYSHLNDDTAQRPETMVSWAVNRDDFNRPAIPSTYAAYRTLKWATPLPLDDVIAELEKVFG